MTGRARLTLALGLPTMLPKREFEGDVWWEGAGWILRADLAPGASRVNYWTVMVTRPGPRFRAYGRVRGATRAHAINKVCLHWGLPVYVGTP